ncbi:MAG: Sec-independent protein translocase protein TatA [Pseudohongiellaceae bacterium]|jgi:Sec-independent protein translocase protein TatA
MSSVALGGRLPTVLALLNIGPLELLLLGAAAVLLFGGDLPDVARKAARMAGRLRGMTNDFTREFHEHDDLKDSLRPPPELRNPLKDLKKLSLDTDADTDSEAKSANKPATTKSWRPEISPLDTDPAFRRDLPLTPVVHPDADPESKALSEPDVEQNSDTAERPDVDSDESEELSA